MYIWIQADQFEAFEAFLIRQIGEKGIKSSEWLEIDRGGERPIARICLDEFTVGYLECALWSSTDESRDDGGDPLDDNYGIDDFAPEALAQACLDCANFQVENDLADFDRGQCGHDFWLTRNGHGAGFWDGDYPEDIGEELTDAAHAYGSVDLYVHEGKVYSN